MKIPESVRIGGVEYAVEYVSHLNNGVTLAYGHIDYDNCKIELSDTSGTGHERDAAKCFGMRSSTASAIMRGWRSRTKRKLWRYSPRASIRCSRTTVGGCSI